MTALEEILAETYPGFEWVSTHGSRDTVRYTLMSDTEYVVLDAHFTEIHRTPISDVAKRASRLDAMETED